MPRRNRVDPWGDLHAVSACGLFTGNRGCIVDEREQVVRHHRSSTLWITCLTEFRDWRVPLALLRDRDSVYGHVFRQRVNGMGIDEVLTARLTACGRTPSRSGSSGSIRRECLNHVLVLGERHLRRILARYFAYFHRARTHLSLDTDAPDVRSVELSEAGRIVEIPEVGGLHHRYVRRAA
jgi:hypothetical protein